MASESTPLIQTVQVGPQPRRYPHQTCRRFFTIACSCIVIAGFASFAVSLFFWPLHGHHHDHKHHGHGGIHGPYAATSSQKGGKHFTNADLKDVLLNTPSSEHAEEWSRYYTSGPHYAGANFSQVSEATATAQLAKTNISC
jgi:N-acetylated-alpha-linked acidic dipeptidase